MTDTKPTIPDDCASGDAPQARDSAHEDWTEQATPLLYIRFTRGPDYENAYLCLDDGEPDMHDLASMSFTQARMLLEALRQIPSPDEGELLPCPFCGGEPILTQKGNDGTKNRSVTVKCNRCFVSRTTGAIRHDVAWCEKKAIEAWNTRTTPSREGFVLVPVEPTEAEWEDYQRRHPMFGPPEIIADTARQERYLKSLRERFEEDRRAMLSYRESGDAG
jgi:Lar family restriction alleviation protein